MLLSHTLQKFYFACDKNWEYQMYAEQQMILTLNFTEYRDVAPRVCCLIAASYVFPACVVIKWHHFKTPL